jgi:hypothetical protein
MLPDKVSAHEAFALRQQLNELGETAAEIMGDRMAKPARKYGQRDIISAARGAEKQLKKSMDGAIPNYKEFNARYKELRDYDRALLNFSKDDLKSALSTVTNITKGTNVTVRKALEDVAPQALEEIEKLHAFKTFGKELAGIVPTDIRTKTQYPQLARSMGIIAGAGTLGGGAHLISEGDPLAPFYGGIAGGALAGYGVSPKILRLLMAARRAPRTAAEMAGERIPEAIRKRAGQVYGPVRDVVRPTASRMVWDELMRQEGR